MGDVLSISLTMRKDELYAEVIQQIDQLLRREPDMFANLGNITAILKHAFNFYWVGFYMRRDSDLVLGPFQGPVAPPRLNIIPTPQSVSGHAAVFGVPLLVHDFAQTEDYPTRILNARSEIAVPLLWRKRTELVINLAETVPAAFEPSDQRGLECILRLVEKRFYR